LNTFSYTKGFVNFGWSNNPIFKFCWLGPVIAYNFYEHHFEKVKEYLKSVNKETDYIMFVVGEVDCRYHLPKQADEQKKSDDVIVRECVERFNRVYDELKGYKIIITSTHPTTTEGHSMTNLDRPIYGDMKRRNNISILWNKYMEEYANQNKIPYLSLYKHLVDENNNTKMEYFFDYCHLNSDSIIGFLEEEFNNIGINLTGEADNKGDKIIMEKITSTDYITWKDFIAYASQQCNLNFDDTKCHPLHYGLSLNGKLPFSINEYEFNYMKDFIIKHSLRRGYELATGIGVSTVGLGLGFKRNNGKLLSLDSYVEENNQSIVDNKYDTDKKYDSEGYTNNKNLMKAFGVDDVVILEKGWSPTDPIRLLQQHFMGEKLDFVFLDCPKFKDEYERDASYLINFIDKKRFVIFVHDTHTMLKDFIELSERYFGVTPKLINKYVKDGKEISVEFPIAMITNIC
jgi:hypothetical protein